MLIYICEDSESDALRLNHHLITFSKEKQYNFDIISFSSGDELVTDFEQSHNWPELLFLDIYMNGKNGIDTARHLRSLGYSGGIIFTTSSTEHAMDSYEVNALYYLQKPYDHSHFINAMERCRHILKNAQQNFTFTLKKKKFSIPYADILFFETGQHTVILHMISGTVSFPGSLTQITELLCQSDNFVSVGRSFLINLNHVSGRFHNDLLMSDHSIVQIPLRKQDEILAIVERWQQDKQTDAGKNG